VTNELTSCFYCRRISHISLLPRFFIDCGNHIQGCLIGLANPDRPPILRWSAASTIHIEPSPRVFHWFA
jgi:hypothetical protein